jgi:MFS family permease
MRAHRIHSYTSHIHTLSLKHTHTLTHTRTHTHINTQQQLANYEQVFRMTSKMESREKQQQQLQQQQQQQQHQQQQQQQQQQQTKPQPQPQQEQTQTQEQATKKKKKKLPLSFILLWTVQFISLLGSDVTRFALRVWTYEETGSITRFAVLTVLTVVPALLISPFAGSVIDRFPRKPVLVISDAVSALCTIALYVLFKHGLLQPGYVFIASFLGSIAGGFQWPAFTATMALLVDKEDLVRYGALNQVAPSLAMMVGVCDTKKIDCHMYFLSSSFSSFSSSFLPFLLLSSFVFGFSLFSLLRLIVRLIVRCSLSPFHIFKFLFFSFSFAFRCLSLSMFSNFLSIFFLFHVILRNFGRTMRDVGAQRLYVFSSFFSPHYKPFFRIFF